MGKAKHIHCKAAVIPLAEYALLMKIYHKTSLKDNYFCRLLTKFRKAAASFGWCCSLSAL